MTVEKSLARALAGQVAVVTGASQGIGLAIARALAEAGAEVVLVSRSRRRLVRAAKGIPGRCLTMAADVSRPEEVRRLFRGVARRCGRLDILVNSAGTGGFVPLERLTLREWQRTLATNLTGTFLSSQAALGLMRRRRRGHIVNILSVAAREAFRDMAAYCASKFGALGFTRVLAEEAREVGIRVTAVLPGATDTRFWDRAPFRVDRRKLIPPEEVARAVVLVVTSPPSATLEEIVLRPAAGNLG